MESVLAASHLCSLRWKVFLSVSPVITPSTENLTDKLSPVNCHLAHWDQNWKLQKRYCILNLICPKQNYWFLPPVKPVPPPVFSILVNVTTKHLTASTKTQAMSLFLPFTSNIQPILEAYWHQFPNIPGIHLFLPQPIATSEYKLLLCLQWPPILTSLPDSTTAPLWYPLLSF